MVELTFLATKAEKNTQNCWPGSQGDDDDDDDDDDDNDDEDDDDNDDIGDNNTKYGN